MGDHIANAADDRRQSRAERVASASEHDPVTESLLLGTGRFSRTFYLHEDPVVAYLDEDERVFYAFYNEMKGVEVGEDRDPVTPDNNGLTVVLVTDRRVLVLVGREDGDREYSLHYDTVTDATFASGDLHDRLVVETTEATYHCWINTRFDERNLEGAVTSIREQMADPHQLIDRLGTDRAAGTDESEESPVASDGGTETSSSGDDDADGDPLERIQRLHELKEAGAITDVEFERKKADLLDQV